MSNYKSNDNSTENTTLKEWWGIVKSEMSRIFEILTQNEEIITITKNEIDSCTEAGLYHVAEGETEIDGSEYYIFVTKYSGALGIPQVRQIKIDDDIYIRVMKSTSEWSEWTEIEAVGKRTAEGGEIFNDYDNNKALSIHSAAMGSSSAAGGKGFRVVEKNADTGSYILDSVDGLSVGDIYSVWLSQCHTNNGEITQIDTDTKTVAVTNFSDDQFVDENIIADTPWKNSFFVIGKPYVGTIDIGRNAVSLGYMTKAQGFSSAAIGSRTESQGQNSFASGYNSTASGKNGVAIGSGCVSSGDCAIAMGANGKATGNEAFSAGDKNTASGYGSTVFGAGNIASGTCSFVSGQNSKGASPMAVAMGEGDEANGHSSVAMGYKCIATGDGSIAGGNQSKANAWASTAFGASCTADGQRSFAAGFNCSAKGMCAVAMGGMNTAQGNGSIAIGSGCVSKETNAVAMGTNNKANAYASAAFGAETIAGGQCSFVRGRHNIEDTGNKYADIVGNGTGATRSNAYTLDWNGNAWFAGDVTVGVDKNKLATEKDVEEITAKIDKFIKTMPVKYEVKCHFGETVPTGETVKLIDIVSPNNVANCVGVFSGNYPAYYFSGHTIRSEHMGAEIDSIENNDGENVDVANSYAVFEVTVEGETTDYLCLTAPNGTVYKLTVDDNGSLSAVKAD